MSVKISIDKKSVNILRKNLNNLSKEKYKEVQKEVLKAAINIDRTAKRNSPVDTGRNRASINFEVKDCLN